MHLNKCSLISCGVLLLSCRPFMCVGYGATPNTGNGMSPPVIGLVLAGSEGSPAVRELVGVPGSAMMLDPLPLPAGTVRAIIAPRQSYGLAVAGDGSLAVFSILNGAVALKQLPGVHTTSNDMLAFAPSGATAACYSPDSGSLQVIEGLPAAPKISCSFEAAMPAGMRLLSISDDATEVLAGRTDNSV